MAATSITPWEVDLAITSGHLAPTSVSPGAGSYVVCLGSHDPNHYVVLEPGDSLKVGQTANWRLMGALVRSLISIRSPSVMPLGKIWRLTIEVDGVVHATHDITNDSSLIYQQDMAANLSNHWGEVELAFKLELVGGVDAELVELPGVFVDSITYDGDDFLDELNKSAGAVMLLHSDLGITQSDGSVDTWTDQINGYVFTGTGGNRHVFRAAGWGPGADVLGVNNTSFMTSPDNDDFAVGGDSFLVVAAIQTPASYTAYEVLFGNGNSGADEGFRCFVSNTGALALYHSTDGAGPGVLGTNLLSTSTRYVVAWGMDHDNNDRILGVHGVGVERGSTAAAITDADNAMTLGGGYGTVGYRPEFSWRSVGMWKRASSTGFETAEVTAIMAKFAAEANL